MVVTATFDAAVEGGGGCTILRRTCACSLKTATAAPYQVLLKAGRAESVRPLARAPQSGVVLLPGKGFVPSSSVVRGPRAPETAQSLPDHGVVESGTTTCLSMVRC